VTGERPKRILTEAYKVNGIGTMSPLIMSAQQQINTNLSCLVKPGEIMMDEDELKAGISGEEEDM